VIHVGAKLLKTGLFLGVVVVGGLLVQYAVERGDPLMFTAVLIAATAAITVMKAAFGPVQEADERAVARSKDAALIAIRWSNLTGLIGGTYAYLLGYKEASIALFGMVVPGIVWIAAYLVLNWRDSH